MFDCQSHLWQLSHGNITQASWRLLESSVIVASPVHRVAAVGKGPLGWQETSAFPNCSDGIQFNTHFGPHLPARSSVSCRARKGPHNLVIRSLFSVLTPNFPWQVMAVPHWKTGLENNVGESTISQSHTCSLAAVLNKHVSSLPVSHRACAIFQNPLRIAQAGHLTCLCGALVSASWLSASVCRSWIASLGICSLRQEGAHTDSRSSHFPSFPCPSPKSLLSLSNFAFCFTKIYVCLRFSYAIFTHSTAAATAVSILLTLPSTMNTFLSKGKLISPCLSQGLFSLLSSESSPPSKSLSISVPKLPVLLLTSEHN